MTNDFCIYELFISSTNQKEHSLENYSKLIDTFDINKFELIEAHGLLQLQQFLVQDGNHRLAILKKSNMFPLGLPNKFLNVGFGAKCLEYIRNTLKDTTSGTLYNGWSNNRAKYGYHSFNIYNMNFTGQRNPMKRLEKIRKIVDFTGKKILDLGCNTGGMLLHMPEISDGCGIDLDEKCLNAARLIATRLNFAANYTFLNQNLNDFNIEKFIAENFLPDYIFLLSLGSWVSDWRRLYTSCFKCVPKIILETNNDTEGAPAT